MRGRRPDPPALQEAKGDPGRRKGKRVAAQAKAAAVEIAAPAAPAEPGKTWATTVEPPAILFGDKYVEALAIWNELGPDLERTNRLAPLHRQAFGMFCIYIAEFWQATRDLADKGRSQNVKTVAGGSMERDRPAVRWRAEAFSNAMEAAKQFGLTPREEFSIFKDQSVVRRESPSLFGAAAAPGAANDEASAAPIAAAKTAGLMSRLSSAPPAARH